MTCILPATVTALISVIAAIYSFRLGRREGSAWILLFCLAMILMLVLVIGMNSARLSFCPPFSWMFAERWVASSIIGSALLAVLAGRVDKPSLGRSLKTLIVLVVARAGVLPIVAPLTARAKLQQVRTVIDPDGVCLQGTNYTCGPAATVTALNQLGIKCAEGELAIYCGSSAFTGTPDDQLAAKLATRYGSQGLVVNHCYAERLEDLGDGAGGARCGKA